MSISIGLLSENLCDGMGCCQMKFIKRSPDGYYKNKACNISNSGDGDHALISLFSPTSDGDWEGSRWGAIALGFKKYRP